ncbi:hypothetical protein GGU11DRAFT_560502 [Lentinula aff. detonsa]|uniref:Uncharacterized protein n=1 Tax=Lentinula aff. detonsa TaxID=2804958 RepID=A0AA38KEM3_9AGAR|nr:hypothetical protein GGU10DRAFT_67858 [Lentinula aff. detonsa]KAJ3798735.1 hypothetical protein GGU11DRAFT_560502 [Lentinula aff. detonsa]
MSGDSDTEEIQSPAVASNSTQSREIPVLIEQNSSQSVGYSVASVAAVILAGSIAHLFLTWGGFTGQKGWDKLIAVEDWVAAFFRF